MQDAGDGRMADHEQQAPSPRHGSWVGPGIQLWGQDNVPASSLSALRRAIVRWKATSTSIR